MFTKSEPELRTMLRGCVERRSGNVATGDVVARFDACEVWAEVSVAKMRRTASAVTFQDNFVTCRVRSRFDREAGQDIGRMLNAA